MAIQGPVDFDGTWGGGQIYFCRGTYGPPNIGEIYRAEADSPWSATAITQDRRIYKYRPSVRASDNLIVYEGADRTQYLPRKLFLWTPQTGRSTPLDPNDWYEDTAPTWAPDGLHVTFLSTRSGHAEVWSINVATGSLAQLTRGERGTAKQMARLSPNGSRLAVLNGRSWPSHPGALEIYDQVVPLP